MARAKGLGTLEWHGGKWRARWVVDGRTYTRSTGETSETKARKALERFVEPFRLRDEAETAERTALRAEADGHARTGADLRHESRVKRERAAAIDALPLADVWRAWSTSLLHREWSQKQAALNATRLEAFVDWMAAEHPGSRLARDVRPEQALAFLASVRPRVTGKTFNDYRALFLQCWSALRRLPGSGVETNPFESVARAQQRMHPRRELTVEELAAVVSASSGETRTLFAIGIYTGLRLGDAATLRWEAVDLAGGFVDLTPLKTERFGTRVRIPLAPVLARVLERTPPAKRRGPVLPEIDALYRDGGVSRLHRRIKGVFRAAGIETNSQGVRRAAVDVGFHSLRHTYVSLCANAGVPLALVQAIVGHRSVAMTRHYFHAEDSALRGAAAALPDVTAPGDGAAQREDGLAAFRAAVVVLRPEQFEAAARILRDARRAKRG